MVMALVGYNWVTKLAPRNVLYSLPVYGISCIMHHISGRMLEEDACVCVAEK